MSRQVQESLGYVLLTYSYSTDFLINMGPFCRYVLHMLILLNALNKDSSCRIIFDVCIADDLKWTINVSLKVQRSAEERMGEFKVTQESSQLQQD